MNSVVMIAPNASREARPEEHQDVDQPDVVRLPHRADAAVDLGPQVGAAAGVAGEQVPHPAAEVGAAEERVGDHADEHEHGAATIGDASRPMLHEFATRTVRRREVEVAGSRATAAPSSAARARR